MPLEATKHVVMQSQKHHESDANDELNGLRWVVGVEDRQEEIKVTRHGRRHKSVRDLTRRVWEAMTPVFGVLTTGSKTHRPCYENGEENLVRCGSIQCF